MNFNNEENFVIKQKLIETFLAIDCPIHQNVVDIFKNKWLTEKIIIFQKRALIDYYHVDRLFVRALTLKYILR